MREEETTKNDQTQRNGPLNLIKATAEVTMKNVLAALRVLLGLFMILNAVVGFLLPLNRLGMSPAAVEVIQSFWNTGYLMHAVKLTELTVGILLAIGWYVPLTLIIFSPVLLNIFLLHVSYERVGLFVSVPMIVVAVLLARQNWEVYRPLFKKA